MLANREFLSQPEYSHHEKTVVSHVPDYVLAGLLSNFQWIRSSELGNLFMVVQSLQLCHRIIQCVDKEICIFFCETHRWLYSENIAM